MLFRFGWHRAGINIVAVKVIANEDIFVACGGGYGEVAGLVGVDGTGDGLTGGVDVVCALVSSVGVGWVLRGWIIVFWNDVWLLWWGGCD